jgi:hypothetical protein
MSNAVNVLSVLSGKGDETLTWDKTKPEEVKVVEDRFLALKKDGYVAFEMDKAGEKGEIISSFNPEVECIRMTPQFAGG